MGREYDIIIYGANGYAATFIIEKIKQEGLKVALSARNINKIKDKSLPAYECTIENIYDVAKKATLLINCAGPYESTGEKIVKGCLNASTHYMDISVESNYFYTLISKYHDEAVRKGIFIISGCGCSSVLSDLGAIRTKKLYDTADIESIVTVRNMVINITSWVSFVTSLSKINKVEKVREKWYGKVKKHRNVRHMATSGAYHVVFQGFDYSVIKRSFSLLNNIGLGTANYSEYLNAGRWVNYLFFSFKCFIIYALSQFNIGVYLLINFPNVFSSIKVVKNPSLELIKKTFYKTEINSTGFKDGCIKHKKLIISCSNPIYNVTAICVSQCASIFLESLEKKIEGTGVSLFEGGVITPGCAFYNTNIIERLIAQGITFELKDV